MSAVAASISATSGDFMKPWEWANVEIFFAISPKACVGGQHIRIMQGKMLRRTHNLSGLGEVDTVLIPELRVLGLGSFTGQLDKQVGQVRDVDRVPRVQTTAYVKTATSLKRSLGEVWDLNTALVDRASALAVNEGSVHYGCASTRIARS